ncbi:MAG: AAA family ATPase [Phycisphaerales bacterium]
MSAMLDKLTIKGFKSIERLEAFKLGKINVLIGANGAGKSNFVEFFRLLRAMVELRLQEHVRKNAPADGFFYNGIKETTHIESEMFFGQNRYAFKLEPTADGSLFVAHEETQYLGSAYTNTIARASQESGLVAHKNDPGLRSAHGPNWWVWSAVSSWQVYHFHDTSTSAGMRRYVGIDQSETLASDASNLAAFLMKLRDEEEDRYAVLIKTIRRIAPFFNDFLLTPATGKREDQVRLRWKRKDSDYVFSPGHLSDGTIRFICLATVLTQSKPPATVVLDEPELGLHPEAIAVLGGLMRSASSRMQIIIATQSPILLNEFEADQVITVDQIDGASRFQRLDSSDLERWLTDFTVGDLWQKGNIRGGVNDA